MNPSDLTALWAVNVDQRRSRREPDRVEEVLDLTRSLTEVLLPFERTAGDEVQGLLAGPEPLVELVLGLARLDALAGSDEPGWRVGIGLGTVEQVAVPSTRAARGPAYLAAREAVESAGRAPASLALRTAEPAATRATEHAETALILLRTVLARRSDKGWEAVDALATGATQAEVAAELGVSEPAISQRLGRALWRESVRGAALATDLLLLAQATAAAGETVRADA